MRTACGRPLAAIACELPVFTVDADVIYLHVSGGRRLFKDLYATAGVRRFAVKYDIDADAFGSFERKPGVWDPLIGLGWHTAGTDLRVACHLRGRRVRRRLGCRRGHLGRGRTGSRFRHFGFTGGYQFLYFKISDTALGRPFTVKQTLHGPIVGVGLYF